MIVDLGPAPKQEVIEAFEAFDFGDARSVRAVIATNVGGHKNGLDALREAVRFLIALADGPLIRLSVVAKDRDDGAEHDFMSVSVVSSEEAA